ncbi:MAG TPA: hypothetical protein DCY84_01120 [Firmicutes bacterium]|nr:hypothetical protein [Bacillota bacterium]
MIIMNMQTNAKTKTEKDMKTKTKAFEKHLKAHALRHPSMSPQDAVKLCFQAAFGAEHLLSDKTKAMEYLQEEYLQTPAQDIETFEPISDDYVRCNLAAWKYRGLPMVWLFEMFCQSAGMESAAKTEAQEQAQTLFLEYLEAVGICIVDGLLPFDSSEWLSFKERYLSTGVNPVRHSQAYREHEHPAYRIIRREYALALPILEKASAIDAKTPKVIAIDGRAAAGKSTIAAILSAVLKSDVVCMDDFFLPPELRTAERSAESGGNIHYERFCAEVLPFLKRGEGFSYRCFDCSIMDFGASRLIQSDTWRIVEGSYSSHPIFGSYADLRVFCDIAPEEQRQRILKRNGRAMALVFAEKWIPMEEQYFANERVREKADIAIHL